MATIKIIASVRNALGNLLKDAFDAGSGPGYIEFYDGTQPAGPATAVTTQVKLGTLVFSDPSGGTASGVLTLGAITQDSSADASGTASWARICDSTGAAVMDVDVSNAAGSGVIKLNTTTIVAGGPIQISSFTFTMPGG